MQNGTLVTGSGRSDGEAVGWPATPPQVAPAATLPTPPVLPRIKVLHVITRFEAGAGGNTLLSAEGMDPERYEVWIAGVPGVTSGNRRAPPDCARPRYRGSGTP